MAKVIGFDDPEMGALMQSVRAFKACERELREAAEQFSAAKARYDRAAVEMSAAERVMGDASRALARSEKV